MSDPDGVHEMTDLAVLYALRALSHREARSFEEHLSKGCKICSAEIESFEITLENMGCGVSEESPPARVRAALLASVGQKASTDEMKLEKPGPFISVPSSEGTWREVIPGVQVKSLFLDPNSGIATSLVRMLPGTSLPVHKHIGVEQVFVLEGDCNVDGQNLGPGDYHRADKDSIHESTHTVNGTMFLLIAPERYEVLDGQ